MPVTIIRLYADDQRLAVGSSPKIASGDQNSVQIQVSFSGNWSDYVKSAVFFSSWDKAVYEVLLTDGKCLVPHEVLEKSGYLHIGVRGVNPDTQAVKTSTLVKYKIEKGAPVGDATSVEPTPDVYQQILKKLDGITNLENVGEIVAQAIADYMEKNPISTGSTATIGVVELLANRWMVVDENLYSQRVTIKGVTENSQVERPCFRDRERRWHCYSVRYRSEARERLHHSSHHYGGEPMNRKIIGVTVGTPIGPETMREKMKAVKTVNGVKPDENGNVNVASVGGGVDFKTDSTLKLENGVLSVNTTDQMEQDNTLPITSAGVYATVGNIEALLKTI